MQKALVVPAIILIIIFYRSSISSWRNLLKGREKWLLLLSGTVLVELLVISTGGFESPFLILIHLLMIGISFIFGFSTAIIFLLCAFLMLLVNLSLHQNLIVLLLQAPTSLILQSISFITIIPIAYIISENYHFKVLLSKTLNNKVKTDEIIFSNIEEMILVTDKDFKILSVNQAVEKIIHISEAELINSPLFQSILLTDSKGRLVTKDTFFSEGDVSQAKEIDDEFILFKTSSLKRNVKINVQYIKDTEGEITQIIFIISPAYKIDKEETILDVLSKARAKYEATMENLKTTTSVTELQSKIIFLDKIEQDVYNILQLKGFPSITASSYIDVAQLCKRIIEREEDFARSYHVSVTFNLKNFGEKDIAPLTVQNYSVKPEELTGPFFTVETSAKYLQLIVEKLVNISVLIASSQKNPLVSLNVEKNDEEVIVTVEGTSPVLSEEEKNNFFKPYYGKLISKTGLVAGSGLEGYLVKIIEENLNLILEIKDGPGTLIFTLHVKKNAKSF
jgi:PAS domain-containing protein